MQKKGYSPLSIRGLENVWDALLHYASTVPETAFDENFREGFLQAEYGFHMDLEYTMYRASRALELLKNYIDFGVVTGISKKQRQEFSNGYHSLITAFADGEARRGLAEGSMKSLWSRLYRLHIFFLDKGVDTFSIPFSFLPLHHQFQYGYKTFTVYYIYRFYLWLFQPDTLHYSILFFLEQFHQYQVRMHLP